MFFSSPVMLDFRWDFSEVNQWLTPRFPCYALTAENSGQNALFFR
jgi:hypothetical protein